MTASTRTRDIQEVYTRSEDCVYLGDAYTKSNECHVEQRQTVKESRQYELGLRLIQSANERGVEEGEGWNVMKHPIRGQIM